MGFARSCCGPGEGALCCSRAAFIEHGLHLLDGLEPGAPTFAAEVLVEHGAMEALDDAVGLGALDAGGVVVDLL